MTGRQQRLIMAGYEPVRLVALVLGALSSPHIRQRVKQFKLRLCGVGGGKMPKQSAHTNVCSNYTCTAHCERVHDDVRARDLLVIERRGGARHRAQHGHRLRPFAGIDGDDRLSEPGYRLRRKLKHDVISFLHPAKNVYHCFHGLDFSRKFGL